MIDLDLKLLAIFGEIYKVKSVSQAAQNLRIAQPTASMGLRRLRQRFNDPLFVRTSTGMEPTPRADELWPILTEANNLIENALSRLVTFDPATSVRWFRVCMTDVSQAVLLPQLLDQLNRIAPSLRIDVITVTAQASRLLEADGADLAIGFIPQLEAGFFEQTLFTESFACLARADHPRIGKSMTLKNYHEESHLQVVTPGTGHGIIERVLEKNKIVPRIALRVPSFLGIAGIVASSDLVCTVPALLADSLAKAPNIRKFKPPIAFPTYAVKQHWHERFHRDPRNQWLRQVVASIFLRTGSKAVSAPTRS